MTWKNSIHTETNDLLTASKKTSKKIAKPITAIAGSLHENDQQENDSTEDNNLPRNGIRRIKWMIIAMLLLACLFLLAVGVSNQLNGQSPEEPVGEDSVVAQPSPEFEPENIETSPSSSDLSNTIDVKPAEETPDPSISIDEDLQTSVRLAKVDPGAEVKFEEPKHQVETQPEKDGASWSEISAMPVSFSNLVAAFSTKPQRNESPMDEMNSAVPMEAPRGAQTEAARDHQKDDQVEDRADDQADNDELQVSFGPPPQPGNSLPTRSTSLPELVVPSFQLTRTYQYDGSSKSRTEYLTLIEQIHSLFSSESRDPDLVKKVTRLYVQANRVAPHDVRLDLLVSFGFEFHKKRFEAERAADLANQKLVSREQEHDYDGDRIDLKLAFLPKLQRIRLKIRDDSARNLNRVVYDCFNLVSELRTEFGKNHDTEAAEEVARFVACIFEKIEIENNATKHVKVANIPDYSLQIARSLGEIDPALQRAYDNCRLALQTEEAGQRLEFINSLNYLVEMASIVQSYETDE